MEDKYILLSMEDEKLKEVAEILGNKTCKKILDFLSDKKESSEKEISDELNIPINTVEYNLKKLLKVRLIEKSKNFFWSKKGKKIDVYKVSNKSIVISPKDSEFVSKLKSILPSFILTGAMTFGIYVYEKFNLLKSSVVDKTVGESFYGLGSGFSQEASRVMVEDVVVQSQPVTDVLVSSTPMGWVWFLSGALLVIFIFSIINWRKL